MLYLFLAILSSSLISIFMRLSEGRIRSNAGLFIFNYAACVVLSAVYMPKGTLAAWAPGSRISMGLGILTGFFLLLAFFVFKKNIAQNGIVLSSIFMKLGVLVPVLISIICFGETPTFLQLIGIVVAVAAIIVFHFEKTDLKRKAGLFGLLVLLLLTGGMGEAMMNIYNKVGSAKLKDLFLLVAFISACGFSLILFFAKREKMNGMEILFGILVGIPNYFSSRFQLLALQEIPAVIVYPVFSVGTILLISIAGIVFFKEKFTKQKAAGLILVLVALALLH